MLVTIVTATYNRSKLLKELYASIAKENSSNLEWIIVDDGSVDDTKSVVEYFKKDSKFSIKYIYTDNGGKQQAINKAIPLVNSKYIIEIDDDDRVKEGFFDTIAKLEDSDNNVAGFIFRRDMDTESSSFPLKRSKYFDLYHKYNYPNKEVTILFKSEVRKQYKYYVYPNEKFVTEGELYHKIDKDYDFLFINDTLVEGEYQESGYSNNLLKIKYNNPLGFIKYYKDALNMNRPILFSKHMELIRNFLFIIYLKDFKLSDYTSNL